MHPGYKFAFTVIAAVLVTAWLAVAAPPGPVPDPGHSGSQIAGGSITGDKLADNLALTGNASINSPTFVVSGSGVGIGTTSPTASLSIEGGGIAIAGTPQRGLWNSRVPLNNTLTTVDSAGDVGDDTSLTIAPDGLPVIAYRDDGSDDLKVAKCGNAACSSGNTVTTVASLSVVATEVSMAIGTDGLPVISYHNTTGLIVAKCGNAACSSGNTITVVDSISDAGFSSSITIGTDGFPVIAYRNATGLLGQLNVAKCGDAACSSGNTLSTVDSGNISATQPSITIGTDGLPVISYSDALGGDLKVAKCGNAACSSGNIVTLVDSALVVGSDSSITIPPDSFPVISYRDETARDLKFVKCGNAACSAGNIIRTLDSAGDTGEDTSITMSPDGFPIIAYGDVTNGDLKVAKCGEFACGPTLLTLTTVDSTGNATDTSIAIGADGLPVISYKDISSGDLKVAKCGSNLCLPFWTRR